MAFLPFDSRDRRYRMPQGAIAVGRCLRLRVFLPHFVQEAWLVLWDARASFHDNNQRVPLIFERVEDETGCWWSGSYTPKARGIVFYAFEYTGGDSPFTIAQRRAGQGETRPGRVETTSFGDGDPWQLTVYDYKNATAPPRWLMGGVMYQIFPDRFAASGRPKQGVPADRYRYREWQGTPAWEQSTQPRSLGNDYWGGDLAGIDQQLERLEALSVTGLYLNPIFEAHSNHRYNTADYTKIDPLLGDKEDFERLCAQCENRGIRVILDGVFSHTGSDSRYFNREGRYTDVGAAQSTQSPYYDWYSFTQWPDQYQSWWGVPTLPQVCKDCSSFSEFITGEKGIARRWLAAGAAGWRLDVADELADPFLDQLFAAVRAEKPDALLIGEVWEDATRKISYGTWRRYLLGGQLDTVMNYPFRQAILDFLQGGDAALLADTVESIAEHYPPDSLHLLMNSLSTHDTERIITALFGTPVDGRDRRWQADNFSVLPVEGCVLRFARMAAALQFTLPGIPCIYYGDELGMQGYSDPFNRGPYSWQQDGGALFAFYCWLAAFRRQCSPLAQGDFCVVYCSTGCLAFVRADDTGTLLVAVNRLRDAHWVPLPDGLEQARTLMGPAPAGGRLLVPAEGLCLLGMGGWSETVSPWPKGVE